MHYLLRQIDRRLLRRIYCLLLRKIYRRLWPIFWGRFALEQAAFPLDQESLAKNGFLYQTAFYFCPIINPPAQHHIFENKLHNLNLVLSCMQGLILRPREIFSFWILVGSPDERKGYLE